jgi:hypothetical protein
MIRERGFRAALVAVCAISCAVLGISSAATRPLTHQTKSVATPTGSSPTDNGVWHAFGGINDGCAGTITASAVAANGDVYVGGGFSICGDVPASFIARWNGSSWSALGSGLDNVPYSIAISGSDVYVVGQISTAGGVPVSGVAHWDGSQWSALGTGIGGTAGYYQMAAVAAQGNDVYVGGSFDLAGGAPANAIAHWNKATQTWSSLGSGIMLGSDLGSVNALAFYSGALHAGGFFDHAGGVSASNVAAWNGTTWSALGTGIDGSVNALAVSAGSLYAGGDITAANSLPVHNLVRWNGTSWVDAGGGTNGAVAALADRAGTLYVGGGFDEAGGNPHQNLAAWNGSTWNNVGGGVSSLFYSRVVLTLAVGGSSVYVGGDFSKVAGGSVSAHFIASWNGSTWSALTALGGHGLYSVPQPNAAVVYAGQPCFGSLWELDPAAGNLACWDGAAWAPLGGNIANDLPFWVSSLFASGTDLYVTGFFYVDTSCCIGRWDGVAWNALGDGIDSDPNTMTVDGDDVYVAGWFQNAGGLPANHMAMWDGAAWHALGAGIDSPPTTLAVFDGKLYAGGYFNDAGGVPANGIAMWDGANWSALGSGVDGQVNALVVHDGALYVAGSFEHAGGIAANSIARWNGTQWSAVTTPLGNGFTYQGFPGYIIALTKSDLGLFAGGFFDTAGGTPAINIARWDGSAFHALGANPANGLDPSGYVMSIVVDGTDVYAAGQFGAVGGHVSANIARFASDEIFGSGFD